jgi:hypothetical protein
MRVETPERPATADPFAPNKECPDATMLADDSGRAIVAMLQKAADMAKNDCERAIVHGEFANPHKRIGLGSPAEAAPCCA